jgi:hypothetical protein
VPLAALTLIFLSSPNVPVPLPTIPSVWNSLNCCRSAPVFASTKTLTSSIPVMAWPR